MDDAADIQEAFKLYHYGSLTYNKNNSDKTLLPVDSVAYHLNGLQVQITTNTNNIELRIPKSLIDAKGDLIVGQFDNMPGKLSAGSDGQILTVNSASTLGLEWTNLPASVLNRTANPQNSNYTVVDSDLNKILILSNVGVSTITIGSTTMPIGTMIPVAILPAAFISVPPESLITFAGASQVNVLPGYNKTLNAQYYGLVYLTKVASNGWLVTGDLVPTQVSSFSVFTFTPPSFSFTPPAFSFTPTAFSVFTFTPTFSVFGFTPPAFTFTPPAFTFTPTPAFSFTPGIQAYWASGCCDGVVVHGSSVASEANALDAMDGQCQQSLVGVTNAVVVFGTQYPAVDCSTAFSFTPTPAFSFTPPATCTPTSYTENRVCNGVSTPVTIYVAADCTETWDCPPTGFSFTPFSVFSFSGAFSFTPPATCTPTSYTESRICNGVSTPVTIYVAADCSESYNCPPVAFSFTPTPAFSFTPFSVFSFAAGNFSFTPPAFSFTPPAFSFTPVATCTPGSYTENRICNGVSTPVTINIAADCSESYNCPPVAFSFTPFSVFTFTPFSVFSFAAFSVFTFTPTFSVFSFTPPEAFSVFSFAAGNFSFTPPAFSFTPAFSVFSFSPSGGCVAGTTLVRTVGPDETIVLKPASEVIVGEEIWSPTFDQLIDESLGETYLWNATEITGLTLIKSSVANITPSEKSVMTINNDDSMKFSREQTILVKRDGTYSFIKTGMLEVGDILFKINESDTGFDELPVTSIEMIDGFETVYKFDAEPTDLLVAGGLALHNLKY